MKNLAVTIFAAAFISVFGIAPACRQSGEIETFAQSLTPSETNSVSSDDCPKEKFTAQPPPKCDFSKYRTLKVRSLKIKSLPQPKYPPEAKEKNPGGCVPVKILVSRDGAVIQACAVTGGEKISSCSEPIKNSLLEELSEAAATQAKFDVRNILLDKRKDYFEMMIVYRFTPSK